VRFGIQLLVNSPTQLNVRDVARELVVDDLPADVAVILVVVLLEGDRVELGADVGLATLSTRT
jgi:hypothetical protein